ncbi:uncharacterized protein BP01DRAFT_213542 [Aspergillus saccharolyticus JOP 1030-1]|uniref:Uncharacterized protein n=1 Tax=Aspergillus saccharolyticus JOP 1030-1 TaxID=1450539 RepID=A0A319AL52_9EURO|nr:hypothetical protein BP01DRAFT_213542 [Aspergillus saccharolyticus JOP 1030-1]PYH47332.1 hypothetical protein BP01DRAFT_213542 [Aspergillus saccharolyticus JOP 1030-1]
MPSSIREACWTYRQQRLSSTDRVKSTLSEAVEPARQKMQVERRKLERRTRMLLGHVVAVDQEAGLFLQVLFLDESRASVMRIEREEDMSVALRQHVINRSPT